ncbi:hypothetical protein D1872_291070 [compost metagenome]
MGAGGSRGKRHDLGAGAGADVDQLDVGFRAWLPLDHQPGLADDLVDRHVHYRPGGRRDGFDPRQHADLRHVDIQRTVWARLRILVFRIYHYCAIIRQL